MYRTGKPLMVSGNRLEARYLSRQFQFAALLALTLMWLPGHVLRAQESPENLVLVTLDGVRWQEVFGGVDLTLIEDKRFTSEPDYLVKTYWHEDKTERRKRLFPFLASVIESQGALIGDRERESYMEVTNDQWFSYPGYNEILTGRADAAIDSNDKNWNPNITFLEVLNEMQAFNNRVMAFASWDVFPYIINTERSSVPVNAGFSLAIPAESEAARLLNAISADAPKLWSTVRVDFLTHGYAMEALMSDHPRVVYIAYGETDDFAHDGSYDRYVDAAYRTDQMLAKLWSWLQSSPHYRDRTTMIITTDHGRGNVPDGWPSHAGPASGDTIVADNDTAGVSGSNEIWLAAIGSQIKSGGLMKGHWQQSQVAATALAVLQLNAIELMPQAGMPIAEILK